MMNGIYLLLGSNMGARMAILEKALMQLEQKAGRLKAQSSLYETAAWGKKEQSPFLNQVIEIATRHPPVELLNLILAIEEDLGRKRNEKWGPRIIDIDLLYYGDLVMQQKNLSLPHPHQHERRFTLVPLCEIAPLFVHPALKKNNLQLLRECPDELEVKVFVG